MPRTSYDRYYEGRKAFGAISSQVPMFTYVRIYCNDAMLHVGPQSRTLNLGSSCFTSRRRHYRQDPVV